MDQQRQNGAAADETAKEGGRAVCFPRYPAYNWEVPLNSYCEMSSCIVIKDKYLRNPDFRIYDANNRHPNRLRSGRLSSTNCKNLRDYVETLEHRVGDRDGLRHLPIGCFRTTSNNCSRPPKSTL